MPYRPVSPFTHAAASRGARAARGWFVSAAVALLAACGGGGSGSDTAPAAPGGSQPLAGPAVRVEVEPVALLLTGAGQQQRLTARAFDRDGNVVATAATWQASRPAQVDVAADGTVRAATALGSGQIVAVVDGVRSAPVVVAVAQPAAGVLLLTDAQFSTNPVAVDPLAEPSIDNAYEVVLTGVPAPAVGSLLLGREGKAIGGEVLASVPEAGGVRVQLRVVPIDRLMQTAQIREDIDLSGLPLQIPDDIAALYDVRIENDEYIFTPRPGATSSSVQSDDRKRALGLKKFKLGPFECDLVGSELPISLAQPSTFTLKFVPSYLVDYERSTGLKKLLFRAEVGFKLKNSLQVSASGLVNLTCEAKLLERLVPLPGFAGLVLGGELQAGVGFETEGTVAIPLLGVEFAAEIKGKMEAGIDCTTGDCRMVSDWKPEASNSLRLITPANVLTNARSEFFVYGYGYVKSKLGLTLVKSLRADAVSVRGGLKFETSLAPVATQLATVAPGMPDYRSHYKLHALAEASAGSLNKGDTQFRKQLQKLGIFKVTLLKLQLSVPLADSPKGAGSFSGADVSRNGEFIDGKTLAFNVKIDPSTADFTRLLYNVQRVRLFFTADGLLPREVASIEAKPGQTDFDLTWVAEGTSGASGRGFAAFVDTVLPVPFSLELGKLQQLPEAMRGRFVYVRTSAGSTPTLQDQQRLSIDADIEEDGAFGVRYVKKNATFDNRGEIREVNLLKRGFRNCTYTETRLTSYETTTSSSQVFSTDRLRLEIDKTASIWRLLNSSVAVPGVVRSNVSVSYTNRAGDCSTTFLTDDAATLVDPTGQEIGVFFVSGLLSQPPFLTGPITVGADGKSAINIKREIDIGAIKVDFTLDLKEEASATASTDLSVALVATPNVKPLGTLTYSVNLQNRGIAPATEVRAEFNLPVGWSVIGRVGWSGCSVSQTTVVCRTERMGVGEQRAFLVDVRAPEALGAYTVTARVSAAEIDTDFSNNRAETVSTIAE